MMRIHELAKRLGWPSNRVITTLKERGEYVTSAMSKVEDPVARKLLLDFAADISTPSECLPDDAIDPGLYGSSAEAVQTGNNGLSFAAELARVKSQPSPAKAAGTSRAQPWLPPILRVLLYEMVIPRRPDHVSDPDGDYFGWELREARQLNGKWAGARLNGLAGDDEAVIKWIRLSSDGKKPYLAADLSRVGITADEASLRLTHGYPDSRRETILRRYRDGHLTSSQALAEIRRWRTESGVG